MQKADDVFEVSWEVCNKVGGIYTVVRSKVPAMQEKYSAYFVVGPYFPKKATDFEEKVPPEWLHAPFEQLRGEGIVCHYGKWQIDGEPDTILLDFAGFTSQKDRIKGELWGYYRIDSINTGYFDFDEPVIWAYAVGRMLEVLSLALGGKKAVAHCHEWLAGAALLYLHMHNVRIATVFTTHATMLGRTMASANVNIYSELQSIDAMKKAYEFGVAVKHQTERACAEHADVFSTVSEITGIEAEHLLGRKPDVLLPNGLNISSFPTFEEASIKHELYKRKIKEFLLYYFFPYYHFDLDDVLIYFLSGRYEFHDKGVDVFISALGRLNDDMKSAKTRKTIVAFLWVPGNIRGIKTDLLENKTQFEDIKEALHDQGEYLIDRFAYSLITRNVCSEEYILGKSLTAEVKRKVFRLQKPGTPPVSTHDLHNEEHEQILSALRQHGLLNRDEDRVKVVFYPIYLTGADHLLNLNYYESMQGSHLGVFPSYYEPWGYTPLEAAALGVASVTTDLAGFGRYIAPLVEGKKNPGVFVMKRFGKEDEEVVDRLHQLMARFAKLSKEERIKNKIEARNIATKADWKSLAECYVEAHNLAVGKKWS